MAKRKIWDILDVESRRQISNGNPHNGLLEQAIKAGRLVEAELIETRKKLADARREIRRMEILLSERLQGPRI